MKKIFVETSVFVRFLTRDNEKKFTDCVKLFDLIDSGKIRPYTSNIVILEILFVLARIYKFPKKLVLRDIGSLLQLRNLTLIEKTDTEKALSIFRKHQVKYADCLIASQVPKGIRLITYDVHFSKMGFLEVFTPADCSTAYSD